MNLAVALLQAAKPSGGIGGIAPVLMPDVPLTTVLLVALFNPAVIAVAFLMGRQLGARADQPAKLLVAAFAAALAGAVLLWIGAWVGIGWLATAGRAAGGIFIASAITGLGWAGLGYLSGRGRSGPSRLTRRTRGGTAGGT
jgi:hypothetical protein